MKERLVLMYLVGLCLIGITIYLFTSVVPTAKFHVFDVGTYGPTEDARYVRTVLELEGNLTFMFPEPSNWSVSTCSLDYTRTLTALNPLGLECNQYSKGLDTSWFLIIYGNNTEAFHSMESCYVYFGWSMREYGVEEINVIRDEGPYPINMTVHVRKLRVEKGGEQRVVLYWLLYQSPYKDAREGTFLFRISSPVQESVEGTLANLKAFAADSMEKIFLTEDIQDTVLEYYSSRYGIIFYLLVAVVYLALILIGLRPSLIL
jgi:hypothetical protein